MNTEIIIKCERRPCLVEFRVHSRKSIAELETRRALFHCFVTVAEVAAPSVMRGGHNGGQLSDVFALVEFSDGKLQKVEPERVRFLDSAAEFDGIAWPEDHAPEEDGAEATP